MPLKRRWAMGLGSDQIRSGPNRIVVTRLRFDYSSPVPFLAVHSSPVLPPVTKAWAWGGADAAVGGGSVHDGGASDEGHMSVREHVGAGDGAGVELRGG